MVWIIVGIIAFVIVMEISNGWQFFVHFSCLFAKNVLFLIVIVIFFTNAPSAVFAHAADIQPNVILTEMNVFLDRLFFVY